jgi:hypothetical protein
LTFTPAYGSPLCNNVYCAAGTATRDVCSSPCVKATYSDNGGAIKGRGTTQFQQVVHPQVLRKHVLAFDAYD